MAYSALLTNLVLTAAVDGSGSDVLNSMLPFLNFGIVGVLIVLVATKRVFVPKWSLDDLQEVNEAAMTALTEAHTRELGSRDTLITALENDKRDLKAANEKLTQLTQDKILPALFEANRLAALQVEVIARRVNGPTNGSTNG